VKLKAAKTMDLALPDAFVLLADEVIEKVSAPFLRMG
jgi:hypothetical protein